MKKMLLDIVIAIAVTVLGVALIKLCWSAAAEETVTIEKYEVNDSTAEDDRANRYTNDSIFAEYFINKVNLDEGWTILEHNVVARDESKKAADYLFEVDGEATVYKVAIECTWRKALSSKGIRWADDSEMESILENRDGEEEKVNLFLIVGVGGEPNAPEAFSIVQIHNHTQHKITSDDLAKYRVPATSGMFSYNGKMLTLQ